MENQLRISEALSECLTTVMRRVMCQKLKITGNERLKILDACQQSVLVADYLH